MKKKVSVVIPSFNRAYCLESVIESVINQTYKNFEIIVVDDASSDETFFKIEALKKKWCDQDIRYIKHPMNKGESGARNTGIHAAQGEYIAFLDSDDAWHEEKLNKQVKFIEHSQNKYDGVVCEYFLVLDAVTGERNRIFFSDDTLSARRILTQGSGYGIGTTLLLRRDKLLEMFDEHLKLFADIDWLYRILKISKIGVIHEPLAFYYKAGMRHGDYIKEHAVFFEKKYRTILNTFSFFEKRWFYATIHWYIALGYIGNDDVKKACCHFLKSLRWIPFRRPGNYFYIFKLFFYKNSA